MSGAGKLLVGGLRRPLILWAVIVAGLALGLAGSAQPALAATITVNTTTDEDTSNVNCSLREAITAANTDAAYHGCVAGSGADTIAFNITSPSTGVRTITLLVGLGALPAITTPMTIDGWSQGVADTSSPYTGSPLIELNGTNTTATSIGGLTVDGTSANGVTIQGLTINRFRSSSATGQSASAAIRVQNGASNVTIKGNYIGLNTTGTGSAAGTPNNNSLGILVTGSTTTNVTIGGTTAAERNVVSGTNGATGGTNRGAGIRIEGGATYVTIKGNYVGTNAAGTGAVANTTFGIQVSDTATANITIGGSTAGERNVVSGNGGGGIQVLGGATYVTIKGNYVGLKADGSAALANSTYGINVSGTGTSYVTIGGTNASDRNVVSGSTSQHGISVLTGVSHITVQGNYAGTNPAGTSPMGNAYGIVVSGATDSTVGGTAPGAGNLLSGNTTAGILMAGTLTNTVIQGNLIGTDASGTALISGTGTGISFTGSGGNGATIGGTSAAARNVIVGMSSFGINLGSGTVTNTTFQGNYIGVMPDGTTAAGNGSGFRYQGAFNGSIVIGGTAAGAGNTIANSTGNTAAAGKGIVIVDGGNGAAALIRGNSIYNNGTGTSFTHLGIDLNDDGVTANDTGDVDTGANKSLNFPVLTSAAVGGGATRVTGTLSSIANTAYQIDAYANDSCDASGYGEGQTYLGSTSVTTDANGNGTFAMLNLPAVTTGQLITATTSDTTLGITSEFSLCKSLTTPGITVTPTSGLVTTEAGGTATFTVQLADMPGSDVTIGVSSSNTGEGTVSPSTLTFHADATALNPQTVTVTGADDAIKDGAVTYSVLLAAASSSDSTYNGMDPTDVSVTNQDDEGTPTLSVANAQAPEGNSGTSPLTFTVSLAPGSAQPVTVAYATSEGTATSGASCGAGVDYVTASGTLTFAATETSKTVPVTMCGDALNELDETLTLTLSTPTNAAIGQATATGTIQNDDSVPALSVANAQAAEGNSGTSPLTFTVSLGAASGQTVTVQYATSNGTATSSDGCGTGTDFLQASSTLTFVPGDTSKPVQVNLCGDTLNEADETFTLTLSNPTNATISQATATGTIQNDDGVPGLSVANAQAAEGNSGATPLTFTVTLGAASAQTVTVQYATSNGTAIGGASCGAGVDYVTASGMLTFTPGDITRQVPVSVCGNTLSEADKTLTLTLSSPTNATISQASATGTIQNDDGAPGLSVASAQRAEGNSDSSLLPFTVTLGGASGQPVTVQYATSNGTATGGAACGPGVDFVAASGTLTFTPGQTSKQVPVTVCGDSVAEPDETFTVALSTPTNAAISQGTATGTIQNDDDGPGLLVAGVKVMEGNSDTSSLTFTVTLSGASVQPVTVHYATGNGTATGGSACGSGVDYVAASGTLTFAPGQTSKQVPVSVCGDTLSEPDETLTLTLATPTNAVILLGTATGTIQNDDVVATCSPRPAVTINQRVIDGKLLVHVATSPLNSNQPNPLQDLKFGALRNARVTLNSQQVVSGLNVSLPSGTTAADFTVERVTAGQDSTVPFTVVDGCGPWTTFVGGGPSSGF